MTDVVDNQVAATLAYLDALGRERYHPTAEEAMAFASSPSRFNRQAGLSAGYRAALSIALGPERPVLEYMLEVGWIAALDGRIRLTAAGRALARALQRTTPDDGQAVEVVLDPGDRFVIARLIERLADTGRALLVDPYFRLSELELILEHTDIDRVLMSRKVKPAERQALSAALAENRGDRPIEVRVTSEKLHDRHIIANDGRVLFLGGSINTVGKALTVIGSVIDAGPLIADHYHQLWGRADRLESASTTDAVKPPN